MKEYFNRIIILLAVSVAASLWLIEWDDWVGTVTVYYIVAPVTFLSFVYFSFKAMQLSKVGIDYRVDKMSFFVFFIEVSVTVYCFAYFIDRLLF